ncbi:YjgN family protein [Brevundimonas goettingensis]|uniref:DUF898 family protein n=1 Tax=Brevundimonas goettingensis TaxID=2774190 RepID=A0A975C4E4_9CAUL|nr:DUF898 family protein [Brevundimonas goettingensis]QTC91680.1 DUF898 family protein [Brevundimonas goettingensis]
MTDTPSGLPPEESAGLPPIAVEDTIGSPPSGGQTLKFDTTLRPSSFLGLSLKNGLLNLITLTLWRFWGKTEVRRRVWQGIRLNGDAFEYTGRGVELFIGFLLALLVLGLPFLLIIFAVQFAGPMYAGLIILPLYLFIFWLSGFGVFTAYRYMASRTTWRGIRFELGGSATGFGFKYLGIMFLNGITLGWYAPAGERQLAESLWSALSFGNRRFRFYAAKSEREGVYGAFALGWFGTIVPYFLFIIIAVVIAVATGAGASTASNTPPMPQMAMMGIIYAVMLCLAPLILLIWAPYQAAILRSITAGVGVDGASFKLNVKAIALWWLIVTNLFFLLITLGFLMPWVQARTARFLVERLTSTGEARVDEALQTGRGPGSGEGLADAFGFSLI